MTSPRLLAFLERLAGSRVFRTNNAFASQTRRFWSLLIDILTQPTTPEAELLKSQLDPEEKMADGPVDERNAEKR